MDKALRIVNISEAKTQLSALVERITTSGGEIIIGKAGKPVAKLVRYLPPRKPRRLGFFKGKIKIAKDFDEWTPELAELFGMTE